MFLKTLFPVVYFREGISKKLRTVSTARHSLVLKMSYFVSTTAKNRNFESLENLKSELSALLCFCYSLYRRDTDAFIIQVNKKVRQGKLIFIHLYYDCICLAPVIVANPSKIKKKKNRNVLYRCKPVYLCPLAWNIPAFFFTYALGRRPLFSVCRNATM